MVRYANFRIEIHPPSTFRLGEQDYIDIHAFVDALAESGLDETGTVTITVKDSLGHAKTEVYDFVADPGGTAWHGSLSLPVVYTAPGRVTLTATMDPGAIAVSEQIQVN